MLSFSFTLLAPLSADAALVACGLNQDIDPDPRVDTTTPCTLCHLIKLGADVIAWIMQIMTIVAVAAIFAMGILYIISAGDQGMMQKAKGGIWAALIGFALILSAWLIVNLVLTLLADPTDPNSPLRGFTQTGTFSFVCDATSTQGTAASNAGASGTVSTIPGGTGSCQAPSSGPCSPGGLKGTCFDGANVNTWAAICFKESGGIVSRPSTVDKCTGDGNVVSFGLFQINISANRIGNLNCPAAFSGGPYTGSNKNCRVINSALYNQCVAAAKNASQNIATACQLAAPNATNTGPWGAARACNIPRSL